MITISAILISVSVFSYRVRFNAKGGLAPWYLESLIIKDLEGHSRKHVPAKIWLKKKRRQVEFDVSGLKYSIQFFYKKYVFKLVKIDVSIFKIIVHL